MYLTMVERRLNDNGLGSNDVAGGCIEERGDRPLDCGRQLYFLFRIGALNFQGDTIIYRLDVHVDGFI